MKVKLIPELSYRVETEHGEPLGVFTKRSEWEGMIKLENNSSTLIVQSEDWIEQLFHRDDKCRLADVVRASPILMEQLLGKTETKTEAEGDG